MARGQIIEQLEHNADTAAPTADIKDACPKLDESSHVAKSDERREATTSL